VEDGEGLNSVENNAEKRDGRFKKGNKVGHRFKPGHKESVGHGRPRTHMLTKELVKQLEEIKGRGNRTELELFIKGIIRKAKSNGPGHAALAQLIWDRIEGKMLQPLGIEGEVVTKKKIDLSDLTLEELKIMAKLGVKEEE
jgi:hypothetical protein